MHRTVSGPSTTTLATRPNGHQYDLAAQVVADLDLFLVIVGGLVHMVIGLRLEEEVARLAARHRHQPRQQRGSSRIDEQQRIGADKADGAQQVQRLVDAAVVVVAVVVPPLDLEGAKEIVHAGSCVVDRIAVRTRMATAASQQCDVLP